MIRIRYNAPFTLSFALLSSVVLLLNGFLHGSLLSLFSIGPRFSPINPIDWMRLVLHVIGHRDWGHLIGNFSFILLIGPILEEKYGGRSLLVMSLITAVATGLFNIILTDSILFGASGIAFMMIIIASITNTRSGDIPLTFLLILLLFMAREIFALFQNDDISQLAHIIGAICGCFLGFRLLGKKTNPG